MAHLLEFRDLSKFFGGVKAVDGFSYYVPKGNINAVIGPNGAGKTTIFNLVTGIYAPTQGDILFRGQSVLGKPGHAIAALGIARTFQNIRLFPEFSVLDNVRTACHRQANYTVIEGLIPTPRRRSQEKALTEHAMSLLELVDLADRATDLSKNLPYGHQRRLEIARALALQPELLLLDEPAAGMNPDETDQLMAFIRDIRQRFDLTILLIEHHMEMVMGLADNIAVIDFGRLIARGTPEAIQAHPEVIRAYLGVGDEV